MLDDRHRLLNLAVEVGQQHGCQRVQRVWSELPGTAHADPTAASADRLAVLAAPAQLAPRQRTVLVLRSWEDQSIEQTAAALRCSTGPVKSQAAHGLERLCQLLGEGMHIPAEEAV
jgi:DNA-directed RNA polymerase specialized sigma24 family protein